MTIGIAAWVNKQGACKVDVALLDDAGAEAAFRKTMVNVAHDCDFEDWQLSVHENISAARGALMSIYGIEWFNRARGKLSAAERDMQDEEAGFQAFPSGRFSDALRGTKSFPDRPRCPFKRPERVAAWQRGYDRAYNSVIDAHSDARP